MVSHAGLTLGADCVIGDFAAVGEIGVPGATGPVTVGERARDRRPRDGRVRREHRRRRAVSPSYDEVQQWSAQLSGWRWSSSASVIGGWPAIRSTSSVTTSSSPAAIAA